MNEYEAMLVAAGWIKAEDVDSEYIEYQQRVGKYDAMSYTEWQHIRSEWEALNAQYMAEVDPFYQEMSSELPATVARIGNQLVSQMSYIEVLLGY